MPNHSTIPFNRPFIVGKELCYIAKAVESGHLAGDGPFAKKCCEWLCANLSAPGTLLLHSCTAALEVSALLNGVGPGCEIIMPSFTFVSTASAFAMRGATPVFVDIRADTKNIDDAKIEAAITPRTRIIVPVHYAGVGCEMDTIMQIADKHGLLVVEDAAQGLGSLYKGRPLGTIGHLGCLSFHETKNIISGEGGALVVNNAKSLVKAEIIRDKGTNRRAFLDGRVDKYTWVDCGSSYTPSELVAAFLYAQLEEYSRINAKRLTIWNRYRKNLHALEEREVLELPYIPDTCLHNAHMFYILTRTRQDRDQLIDYLQQRSIHAVFHYVPLHSSPAGRRYGRTPAPLPVTDSISERLIRLPCFFDLSLEDVDIVCSEITEFYNR